MIGSYRWSNSFSSRAEHERTDHSKARETGREREREGEMREERETVGQLLSLLVVSVLGLLSP